jgi:sRNA-binding protein
MNQHQKLRIRETLKCLQGRFPHAFIEGQQIPLKIGILEDIFKTLPEDGSMSRKAVRDAIKFYTRGFYYHISVLKQTHRIDLDGNPSFPITEEEKRHSAECLKAIKNIRRSVVRQKQKNRKLELNNKG